MRHAKTSIHGFHDDMRGIRGPGLTQPSKRAAVDVPLEGFHYSRVVMVVPFRRGRFVLYPCSAVGCPKTGRINR